nr:hypothetical protein [Clostridia bacterium]
MNLLAGGFVRFVNSIFDNWQMILFAILAVLLLLVIVFRKVKLLRIICFIAVPLIVLALLASLIYYIATMHSLQNMVDLAVRWVPTVLFAAIVVLATWLGSWRGLRKSLILLLHEVIVGSLCIILYAVLIKLPQVNKFALDVVNFFMGGKGALQRLLKVSEECYGIKEVFVEWLPTVIKGDFSIMLGGSAAYIYTLADLIYRVVFALLIYVVYNVFIFILYIIYHIFYSERKYRRKITKRYAQNRADRRYSRHYVGGGVVGLVRGVAIGLISLSFLGTAFYIVAGRGEGKLTDYDTGNEQINEYYSVYRSVESYGSYGIFKVLNAISSTEDVPYYLFAADLVFSGELDDEEFGVTEHIVFREELSAYTTFARDTMALLIKYGGEDIKPLLNSKADKSAFDTVVGVISDSGFRREFNDLISEFDAQTYVINFAMSFVNTAIANIDDMNDLTFLSSLSTDNKELLKILFTKGYLTEVIPDEKAQKLSGSAVQVQRPYINVSKLVDKNDVQIIFNVVMDALTEKISGSDQVIKFVGKILPEIRKVSLLNGNRAEELDPVLCRLYCYAANRYLSDEGSEGITYTSLYRQNIEWVGEINSLIDVADSALGLYSNVYSQDIKPLDAVTTMFDKNNKNYEQNCRYYDTICDSLVKSKLLGKVLSTSYSYKVIENALSGVAGDVYLPNDLVYESTYDNDGKLVSSGEVYYLLNGVRIIDRNSSILSSLNEYAESKDLGKIFEEIAGIVTVKDESGNTVADYFSKSRLLRSVFTASFINLGNDYTFVPDVARDCDSDGNRVAVISEKETYALIASLPELTKLVSPILSDPEADISKTVADFIGRENFRNLLDSSTVFEGTVAKVLVSTLGDNETITISHSLKTDLNGWVTQYGKSGELKRLLNAIDVIGIEISSVIDDGLDSEKIAKDILSLSSEEIDACLDSSVLHYTVSSFLTEGKLSFGSFNLIIPDAACVELKGDVVGALVKKEEFKNIMQ